jgi:hypothetical protein
MAALRSLDQPLTAPVYDPAITWGTRSGPGSLVRLLRVVGVLALAGAMAGCSGDDDAGDTTTTAAPTTAVATTESPPTTSAPPTTAAPTTAAPSTTLSAEALKAQIAEDYERAAKLRDELTRNPTLEGLEEQAARIAAPGSPDYSAFLDHITGMAERGERIVAGEPDINDVTVELVELSTDAPDVATVTACQVFNSRRIDPDGQTIGDTGVLTAIRIRQQVQRTSQGWLPASPFEALEAAVEVTACPATS